MKVRIWDLPLRLFHWLLVALIVISYTTGQIGGNLVQYHFWSGYAILALVVFRILWGVVGGFHARFWNFIPSPSKLINYLRGRTPEPAGHNPIGAFSVIGLLTVILVQTISGLFSNDDIASEGPLVKFISKDLSDQITHLHEITQNILLVLVGLHLAAILFYLLIKRKNLIKPMLCGDKELSPAHPVTESRDTWLTRLIALFLLAVCAVLVYAVVNQRLPF